MFERSKKTASLMKRLIAVAAVPALSILALSLAPHPTDSDASALYVAAEDTSITSGALTTDVFLTNSSSELVSRADGNELLLMDVLTSDQPQVGEELERSAERAALRLAVERLAPRERQIMELRFGLNREKEHTQKEVADTLGISQSYISRLEKRIIKRLRRELETVG